MGLSVMSLEAKKIELLSACCCFMSIEFPSMNFIITFCLGYCVQIELELILIFSLNKD
jgi:hypothetical protein